MTYLDPAEVGKKVKVRADSCDGHEWIEAYTPEMESLGMAYVEVDLHTWTQWQAHCAASRAWNSFCQALGAEQYEKEHQGESK